MMAAAGLSTVPSTHQLVIEGYASVFGVADRAGDIVRAGAFARALGRPVVPMLLQHQTGAIAGRWVRIIEDGFGLFVRGVIESAAAQTTVHKGLRGLSIGFRPQVWTARPEGGRTLIKIDLVEISLVSNPMLDAARFELVTQQA
ncbi:MAG: HK97 family phage prohead protease [Pseudomonadota bacterium]